MRVLVTGASGYLGQHLIASLSRTTSHTLLAAYGSLDTFEADYAEACTCVRLDLADRAVVLSTVGELQPDVVVHLAAVSSPAACERNPEGSRAINECSALIDALPARSSLIFLSTDQVYDGSQAPYSESSPTEPINVYGASKLAFERALTAALPERSVCLRSSLILGPPTPGGCRKQSFLQFCDERLAAGTPTDFFSDEWRSVISVEDIVAILRWFIDGGAHNAPGVYNMGGPERVSRSQLALAVCAHRGYDEAAVKAVPRASVVAVASGPRSPPDITMDSSQLASITGIRMRSLSDMLVSALPLRPA